MSLGRPGSAALPGPAWCDWLTRMAWRTVRVCAAAGTAAALAAGLVGCSTGDPDPDPVVTTAPGGQPVTITPTPTPEPTEEAEPTAIPTTLPIGSDPADAVPTTLPTPSGDAATATAEPPELSSGVRLDVPAGWTVVALGALETAGPEPGTVPPERWCLVPSYPVPEVDGCAGVVLDVGGDWLPGGAGEPYAPNQPFGWRWESEPLLCPFDEDAELDEEGEGNVVVADGDGMPLTSAETRVGELLMRYQTWRVRCSTSEEDVFTPQQWQVPGLNVLVTDVFGSPDTLIVLLSLGRD